MTGRAPSGQALAVPAEPCGLVPSGFDPSRGEQLCAWCCGASAWRPIATLPVGERALLGSYYDNFRLRPPFVPIWQMTEGHAFEYKGEREFSLLGRLEQPPTHWMPLLTPPPYEPSAEQIAIATEARRAETLQDGSVHEGAGPKGIAHE